MKEFFIAHTYLELQLNEEALKRYTNLSENGFSTSTYIISQIAVAHHNVRGMLFKEICVIIRCNQPHFCSGLVGTNLLFK